MKFCRGCGASLANVVATPMPGALGPPPGMMQPPGGLLGSAPMMQPGSSPMIQPATAPGAGVPGRGPAANIASAAAAPGMINCPRCGTPTPIGFAYCQQCGLHMQGMQPTDPQQAFPMSSSSPAPNMVQSGGTAPAGRPMSNPAVAIAPMAPLSAATPVDPMLSTLAADGRGGVVAPRPSGNELRGTQQAGSQMNAPAPGVGPAWGTAILVNRDGSDGQRFSLVGEYCVVGRAGADIAFDDDRFLARQHARFERGTDGVVKLHPLDSLNGVFKKADAPVELADGTTLLVGREVLRFETVDPEEQKVHPLVRHGVALFGSPPREPWGRLLQIIPSGGIRDLRHLHTDEVVLGREEGDIVFRDDAFMSRRHAAITWDKRVAKVTDLGSSNGTFVRLEGMTAIRHGDHVRMGDQLLRIELGK
jgi:pSer/pThr/pTyr-binding forkhead associated (FHA) protein